MTTLSFINHTQFRLLLLCLVHFHLSGDELFPAIQLATKLDTFSCCVLFYHMGLCITLLTSFKYKPHPSSSKVAHNLSNDNHGVGILAR